MSNERRFRVHVEGENGDVTHEVTVREDQGLWRPVGVAERDENVSVHEMPRGSVTLLAAARRWAVVEIALEEEPTPRTA